MPESGSAADAEALLRLGDLAGALQVLQAAVRAAPGSARERVFLAQLLMVQGAWQRALAQLQVAAQLDEANATMAHAYRLAIAAEAVRRAVFAGERSPPLLGEPMPWMATLLDAVSRTCASVGGPAGNADALLDALGNAPQVAGHIDGQRFAWLGDSDMRLGPMFELIVNGTYYWVPGQSIRSLRFEAPQDLRDLVWLPVDAEWRNGGTASALMPVRYPAIEGRDAALLMARRTEYEEICPSCWIGLGQRVFVTDEDEHAALDVRVIEFDADAS